MQLSGLWHYYNSMRGKHLKKKIISRNYGYHGATYVAAELTGIHATKVSFDRVGQDFIHHVSAANMYAKPDGDERGGLLRPSGSGIRGSDRPVGA